MRKLIEITVFVEERSGKTGIFPEIGQEKTRQTSPKIGIKFRGERASANILQPTKPDKSLEKRHIYTVILNFYAKNLNSESSKNATKADQKAKQSTQSEATTKTI